MNRTAASLVALIVLAGCHKIAARDDSKAASAHGRYLGIGVFDAGEMWGQLDINEADAQNGSARLADDEHVIVVVDSRTGEIRECGDLSGRCVSMNPWTKPLATQQNTPVKLHKHAADLRAEEQANQQRVEANLQVRRVR